MRNLIFLLLVYFLSIFGKKETAHQNQSPKHVISSFSPGGQYILLTFSGGPHSVLTSKILDILKEKDIQASFFVFGRSALYHPQIIKRIISEGHDIGHQGFYPKLTTYPNVGIDFFPSPLEVPHTFSLEYLHASILATERVLLNITNSRKQLEYYRPPPALIDHWKIVEPFLTTNHSSLKVILSSLDSNDRALMHHPHELLHGIISKAKPGDIILCHDSQPVIVQMLSQIIDQLTIKGYEFLTFSQMFSFPDDTPK
jgi:peptidoglycan-N-acetylglucosamine deacetylase